MDNRINHNKANNINFSAVPKTGEVKTVEKLMKEIIADTLNRAEREVAEYGSFTFSIKKFKNPNEKLVADKFWIEIEQAPKGIEDYQKLRGVYFHAQKKGFDVEEGPSVHILLETGTKKEILEKIKNETFLEKLIKQADNLSYHLIDLH